MPTLPLSLVALETKGLLRSQEWIILWDMRVVEGRLQSLGAEAWRCVCIQVCWWLWRVHHALVFEWKYFLVRFLKVMHQDQHKWAELVCSSPVMNSLCRILKNKHHIFLFYLCVEHNTAVSVQKHSTCPNVKDETQEGMLSMCCNTILFTVHFMLSNGLSHLVTPHFMHTSFNVSLWLHEQKKSCCRNLHFFHFLPLLLIYRYEMQIWMSWNVL